MKTIKTYERYGVKEICNKGSYEVGYCRLTVIDASEKIKENEIDNLFVAFKEGCLDRALEKMKSKYKKLKFQSEKETEFEAKVTITAIKTEAFKKN